MGRPKPFVRVGGRSLLEWVAQAARSSADEVVIVSRGPVAARIEASALEDVRVVRDRERVQTPLVGLLAGAEALRSEYAAALACDVPFVKPQLLRALFLRARGRDAAIPRWSNGEIEPLVAVYRRTALLAAARASLAAGERANQQMVARLPSVQFVSTEALRPADAALRSFVNVNTPTDLARARRLARPTTRPVAHLRTR